MNTKYKIAKLDVTGVIRGSQARCEEEHRQKDTHLGRRRMHPGCRGKWAVAKDPWTQGDKSTLIHSSQGRHLC